MSRTKFIAANWKLNMKQSEAKAFVESFLTQLQAIKTDVDVILCPSFTSLATVAALTKNSQVQLGAQNFSQYASGAYTGEINAEMLLEIGVKQIIIGHSERRVVFKEDDSIINAKVKTAFAAGLNVILCCGESDEQREAGLTDTWVAQQIASAIQGIDTAVLSDKLVIAYEPIWAIGTGKTCAATEANRVIKVIRNQLKALNKDYEQIRILYGGSVKSSNATEILTQSDIDGALVGGASLDPVEFSKIVANSVACYN